MKDRTLEELYNDAMMEGDGDFEKGLEKLFPDFGGQKTKKVYSEQYSQGFNFVTNVRLNEVPEYSKEYKEQGFDVFVGEKAFRRDGTENPKLRTILIRENFSKNYLANAEMDEETIN